MSLVHQAMLLFALLLMMPLGLGLFWYFANKKSVLAVKSDRKRDPRYFSKSFRRRFDKAWPERKGSNITMSSRPEPYVSSDTMNSGDWKKTCRTMVVAEHQDFAPPPKLRFEKEIAANHNALISHGTVLRAISVRQNLTLAPNTRVVRWADADGKVTVGNHCDLGMSTTSGSVIRVGMDCKFRRLYAPLILLGMERGNMPLREVVPDVQRLEFPMERTYKRHVGKDEEDSDTGSAESTFLSPGKITVDENTVVQGSLRARDGIRIGENAVVCGNVFADGCVHLGKNSTVLGNVFSQEDVYMESGVIIGRKGQTRSVVARGKIQAQENCVVHGYLSNESGGTVCPSYDRKDENQELLPPDRKKINNPRRVLGGAAAAAAIAGIMLGAGFLVGDLQQIREEKVTPDVHYRVEAHRNQGLDPGQTLARRPMRTTPERVEFYDRVLLRCDWTEEELTAQTQAVEGFLQTVGERYPNIRLYSSYIPLRIGFEETFSDDAAFLELAEAERQRLLDAESYLSWRLSYYSTFVPTMEALTRHQEEYIFFRSNASWTTRGCYYGAQEFLKAAELETFPITDFHEFTKTVFRGSLQNQLDNIHEAPYMYLYDGYQPLVTDVSTGERPPMFTSQRGGTGGFMGSDSAAVVMDGLAENGRCLLVMGSKPARMLPPWMVTRFEKILFVNLPVFSVRKGDRFWPLLSDYGVTDMLVAVSAGDLSSSRVTKLYRQFSGIA